MKVELVNNKLDACNTELLKATSSKGTMFLMRKIMPKSHYQEGEERKAFYDIICFDSCDRGVCGDLEDKVCGNDYRRVKNEFLRLTKDNSYLEMIIEKSKKWRKRK